MAQKTDLAPGLAYLIVFLFQVLLVILTLLGDQADPLLLALRVFSMLLWYVVVEIYLHPIGRLIGYTRDQIYFARIRRYRTAKYLGFRASVKDGSLKPDEFEDNARQVIK